MVHWEHDVRSLLRPSEYLLLVLEGSHLRHHDLERDSKAPSPTSFNDADMESSYEESRVILAIVGHMSRATGESGSVFLYTENKAASRVASDLPLVLQHTFAVHAEFSLEISQFATSSSAHTPGGPADTESLPPGSPAVKRSSDVVSYKWLEPYTFHPSSWLSVKPPPDLRDVCQPFHSSLSPGCAGMPVHDVADYVVIRDDWLWSQSSSLATGHGSEKTQLRPIDMVGGHDEQKYSVPPLRESSSLSLGDKGPSQYQTETEGQPSAPEADILVMAFQELDLSTEAFLYFAGPAREDAWTAAVLAALGDRAERYEKLVSKRLVGILLIVFVKKDLRSRFTGIMEGSAAAGIMASVDSSVICIRLNFPQGVMGNKGAVAVRLDYRPNPTPSAPSPIPITFTFVNSHLAAFDDHIERRNIDFHDISRRIEFGPLNLPDSDVRHILTSVPTTQGISALLQYDELKSSIRHAKAFAGFDEHPITFLPTYRFAATVQTDAAGYDTKRKPAWTDRVLHRSSPFVPVSQRSYNAHPSITMSDHRPVSAEFLVDIPCIDSMALDRAANDLYTSSATFDLDDPDQSGIPLLKLEETMLDFGKVSYVRLISSSFPVRKGVAEAQVQYERYSKAVSQSLSIQNAGKVPAAFRFFPRDLGSPIHPEWLEVEPVAGFLLPGEETTLRLTIFVSPAIAAPLNLRQQSLSTLLIVHTLFGQDLFLAVGGEYEPSCFGTPLSALARLPGPIRELKGPNDLLPETQMGHPSREFMKLMGWLTTHDVEAIHDLFIAPGDKSLAAQIRESLDTGAELPPCAAPTAPQTVDANYARTVAAVLLAFLRSLPEPVVPFSLHQLCAETTTGRDAALEMLSAFPLASVNVWISVTAFLHLLALRDHRQAEAQDERPEKRPSTHENAQPTNNTPTRAEILASIFAPVLLRDDVDAASPVSPLGKKRFLLLFMGES
ncbi:hypothetical protein BC826DRAFT_1105265 [Russula brevipes]|nr:hypothetical protein BC826DRAFT_1105265 [Russula brevipes]